MKQIMFGLVTFVAASFCASLCAQKTNVITITSEDDLRKNAKVIKADSIASVKDNPDAELDAYINSIDWDAERVRWLEWYGTTNEPDLTEKKIQPKQPK
jgi:anaerobic glycerol-3-phosphate dehydrogenase